jgi:hypothetical protein
MTAPKVFLLCVTFRVLFFCAVFVDGHQCSHAETGKKNSFDVLRQYVHTSYFVREREKESLCCNTPPKGLADSMTMRDEEDGKHFRFVLFSRGLACLRVYLVGGLVPLLLYRYSASII